MRTKLLCRYIPLLLLLTLSACGGGGGGGGYSPYGGTENPTQVKIGKPYMVKGVQYVPKYDAEYTETGMASWYGPDFHGRMTASGERYDKHEMTAAHRTLPMPSIVRVTRMDTGKTIKVRVNDRGPFSSKRIIDLSYAAAQELNMIGVGTARVRVQYIPGDTEEYIASLGLKKPEGWGDSPRTFASVPSGDIGVSELPFAAPSAGEKPKLSLNFISSAQASTPAENGQYRIQAASFADADNAERVAATLRNVAATIITPITGGNGQQFYRVSLGRINTYPEAERLLDEVKAMGYRDARIMVDGS